ncbi:hypothetical protein HOP62_08600 [Halomonas sp. MCCC 1A17488]|uniref:site-specific integrase n=1 Tax=unclassified Halomonas TaxID=2609666 RepID=UPI0018D22C55|nr:MULTISPECIES: site-specific integrase [unclassified Halomonas]MCE8016135.1 hypothetical protein [Halomonas sp. MCCC 1A17488]MCG3239468.1 hypothetical protein [Halomonas sp. MCCC 1A17488]QPP50607.1 phage integrase N-terminal SAM-like domain-containing protein [Halomonas sp. SS10-MC5]
MDTHIRPPKLMVRVKATMRVKRYSPRTEKTYFYWIRYFIRLHGVRHPSNMGGSEVRAFLEHLAVERHVAAATQNQALNAIVFLYRHGTLPPGKAVYRLPTLAVSGRRRAFIGRC